MTTPTSGRVLTTDVVRMMEPFVWEQLSTIQKDYPDVFLAGGYLRDRLLGLNPKDVDFFTFLPLLEGRSPDIDKGDPTHSQGGGETRVTGVEQVFDYAEVYAGKAPYEVQVIHLNPSFAPDCFKAVELFAFGLQQILLNPDTHAVDRTQAFNDDVTQRKITVWRCHGTDDAHAIYKKYQHLTKTKFRDWQLHVPEKWVKEFSQFSIPDVDFKVD